MTAAASSAPRRVRCRLCDWSRPVMWTNADGKARSGFTALKGHFLDAHKDAASEIEAKLNAERDARRPVTRQGDDR